MSDSKGHGIDIDDALSWAFFIVRECSTCVGIGPGGDTAHLGPEIYGCRWCKTRTSASSGLYKHKKDCPVTSASAFLRKGVHIRPNSKAILATLELKESMSAADRCSVWEVFGRYDKGGKYNGRTETKEYPWNS